MTSWRDTIVGEFAPDAATLTLAFDGDGLLLDEQVLQAVKEQGYELVTYDEPIHFRYLYEVRFRENWDRGERGRPHLVIRFSAPDTTDIPYDILVCGRQVSFSLAKVFPGLDAKILAEIDVAQLDIVYQALLAHRPGLLGENATKEFLLQHVFGVAPSLVREPVELIRLLLDRHYRGLRVPSVLDDYLVSILRERSALGDWPLELLLRDREVFFGFLQERWPCFLDRAAETVSHQVSEPRPAYRIALPGPVEVPFDQPSIRVFVDNLFLDGLLSPVAHTNADAFSKEWFRVGVVGKAASDTEVHRAEQASKLLARLASELPSADARYQDWLRFVRPWAELTVLRGSIATPAKDEAAFLDFRREMDGRFEQWLAAHYAALVSLPASPPVMLHHVGRHLAYALNEKEGERVALLVLDGMSYDQWNVVREVLASQCPDLVIREDAVFAWVPTLTSVSRQALFAVRSPFFFPESIHATDKEPAQWRAFWADQKPVPIEVYYERALGKGESVALQEALADRRVRAMGLVIDSIDEIMHGMHLGAAGMHNQVRMWAAGGYLSKLLNGLVEAGFVVFLTSDHGNTEAVGCGTPAEGAAAGLRGERARVYPNELLRERVRAVFTDAVMWDPVGLPHGYVPLLAPARKAFVALGERVVAHGGASIEEVIVPLVCIEGKHSDH